MKKIAFIILCLFAATLQAQWSQLGTIIHGKQASDAFGDYVTFSKDGSVMAVSGYLGASVGGGVRVYQFDQQWTQLGNDLVADTNDQRFGQTISLSDDGTILAIGVPRVSGYTGYVQVFQYVVDTWVQIGDNILGEEGSDFFGESISISPSGTYLAVGARSNNVGSGNFGSLNSAGHVRVFQYLNGQWQQIGSDIDGTDRNQELGTAVSISENGNFVAARSNPNYPDHAEVFVYQKTVSGYQLIGSAIDLDEYGESSYPQTIALSSDGATLVIGSEQWVTDDNEEYNRGRVFIYSIQNNTLSLEEEIRGDSSQGSRFGNFVGIDEYGTKIAVLAPRFQTQGAQEDGKVFVYEKNNGSWGLNTSFVNNQSMSSTMSSMGFSKDGNTVGYGVVLSDVGGLNTGSMRVFRNSNTLTSPLNSLNSESIPFQVIDGQLIYSEEHVDIVIYNALGQEVKNKNLKGFYVLKILDSNFKTTTTKIVIE